MLDVLKAQLVCEFETSQNEFDLVLEPYQASFASKDQFFLIKSKIKLNPTHLNIPKSIMKKYFLVIY